MSEQRVGLSKYFIAIVPPSPLYEEASALKSHFKDQYQSKAALNSPPHITLHMPFEFKSDKESQLIEKLNDFIRVEENLQIDIDGFDCFKPRVIFLKVKKTEELSSFQKKLESYCKRTFQLFNAQYRDLPFHPHLTLAFRDLKKTAFEKAWEEFSQKKISSTFMADRITLLKHNGKIWEVFKEFSLA